MKISFQDTSSQPMALYWCARGGKELPYGFNTASERVVQVAQFFRGERSRARGRGNNSMSIEFSVDKEYASLEDANLAAAAEESLIPGEGILLLEETSQVQMASAFQNLSISQRGVTLTMRYRFVGGGFTTPSGAPISVPSTLPSPNR